ncbi:MAG: OmpA family protein, partial [Bacteroidetes bacterium]|nr:OmpA family protein [Candidatus Cryptobacteroides intestinigallinarum]
LTPADQIRLTVLADQIKKGPQDYVYTITGYADFNTGTQDRNTALSVKRAKTVYDFLISLGVPAEQLAYSGTDRNSQPFSGEGNQTVIIR